MKAVDWAVVSKLYVSQQDLTMLEFRFFVSSKKQLNRADLRWILRQKEQGEPNIFGWKKMWSKDGVCVYVSVCVCVCVCDVGDVFESTCLLGAGMYVSFELGISRDASNEEASKPVATQSRGNPKSWRKIGVAWCCYVLLGFPSSDARCKLLGVWVKDSVAY